MVNSRPLDQIRCPERAIYKPIAQLLEAIPGNKFIIGATGRGIDTPVKGTRPPFDQAKYFLAMDHDAVLVNASSKTEEFNWTLLGNINRPKEDSVIGGRFATTGCYALLPMAFQ